MNEKYEIIKCPSHPFCSSRGYVFLHRHLMEQKLGRYLEPEEVVHHVDGNRKNNNIDNLALTTKAEHARGHKSTGRTYIEIICPQCGNKFKREKRNTYGKTRMFCSQICSGKYYASNLLKNGNYTKKEIVHGTYSGYRKGCRCIDCKAFNAKRRRLQRARKRGVA